MDGAMLSSHSEEREQDCTMVGVIPPPPLGLLWRPLRDSAHPSPTEMGKPPLFPGKGGYSSVVGQGACAHNLEAEITERSFSLKWGKISPHKVVSPAQGLRVL